MLEEMQQLNKKTSQENITTIEKQIKNIKESIHKFYTEMKFIDTEDVTSRNKYQETIKQYEEELMMLENTCKRLAKVDNPNYATPEEETVGNYKGDGKPVISMEDKLPYIVSKINKALGDQVTTDLSKSKALTEDLLEKLTNEVRQEIQKEKSTDISTSSFEKFDSVIQEMDENEASFKIHFPELNINDNNEISFLNEGYEETYNYLKNKNEQLKGKLLKIRDELENKL